ncbi:uncharacterized protein LOC104884712 [Beta vulgaris subsp. vulgaris]|uniref:uncharacterized protein LOC104884712 n=1 Tax=Beta vulgaris subsp. vulgaris TaxID=3555 RepID=UPI00053FB849|nr:uncharacterized protein LOC104884712 [Beta vulgaris subsp. vulgaris]
MRSVGTGRQGERGRNDQDQVANSKTPTEQVREEEEEEAQETEVQLSSQPRKGSEYRRRVPISLQNSPFSTVILQEPMEKIKMQKCKYDGKTDPEDHTSAYEGHMLLYADTDSVWCKVFSSMLVGLRQTWFKSIPLATVFDFHQLIFMFVTHFVSNKRREKTTGELMSIKQGDSESLRGYVGRFNAEAVTIPSLQQEVAVLALMTGRREGTAFRSYLGCKKLTSLTEVLRKANDFIRGEEFDKAATAKRPAGDRRDKEKDRREDKYRKDH